MLLSAVDSLNATFQKTHEWLDDLAREGGFMHESQAYSALRSVLHALRDRLTIDEAAHLAAQLPMLVRGFYYEGWKPAATPHKERRLDDFLRAVAVSLGNANVDPEHACRAVFAFLRGRISAGEIGDIRHMLPAEIRALWD
jgi:uncharacterized protein (DUF2267 family)